MLLTGCHGVLSGVYGEPPTSAPVGAGQMYLDASDWHEWHYIDLEALRARVEGDPQYNASGDWVSMRIPQPEGPVLTEAPAAGTPGLYTYWYDVLGSGGLANNRFYSFQSMPAQPEPEAWTLAIHRNNARTNGCTVAATDYTSFDQLPADDALTSYLSALTYTPDTWNERDVWTVQERMLSGYIGNQGISVNETLSSWLYVYIPPIPPAFTLNSHVFILRTPEGEYVALQLADYQNAIGTKCHLTINYKFL